VARKNIERQELKNPDQFVTFWSRMGTKLAQQRRAVAGVAVGLIVVVAAAWGVARLMSGRSLEAAQALARVQRIASSPLLPATGETPPSTDDLPRFKTATERNVAVLKEIDTFLGAHGGSSLAEEARLLKARHLLASGKHDEAAALYQELLGGKLDDKLKFVAREGLAYAHEAAGQTDKAIAAFGALADESANLGNFYRDRALYNKARLLEKKGSPQEAQKVLREILDKIPTTPLREEITNRLAILEGK
jgi:tetratricopeptide (TPR) repeat protein